jgi:hypothetical protein
MLLKTGQKRYIIIRILNLFFENSFSVLKEEMMGGRKFMAGLKKPSNVVA